MAGSMRLSEIAHDGVRVVRDAEFRALGLVTHTAPAMLVFVESERFIPALLARDNVCAVLTSEGLSAQIPERIGVAVSSAPRKDFIRLHNRLAEGDFYFAPFPTEIAKSARVHPRAYVAERNVRIGERVVIEPNATVLERSILEDDVVIRAGCVIGGEGFQFARIDDELLAMVHAGGVQLGRGVEIQNQSCVDRALFGGFTSVGEQTKLDNFVHIAHNCQVGKRNLIAACAMLAGTVTTGDDVWIGPQAAISSEVTLGSRAHVTLGAVVTRDVPEGEHVSGNFAIRHGRFLEFLRGIR
jgi:UDP-3-O-[3-hydroxymyristoyl] glucosamine N-acyltransferase